MKKVLYFIDNYFEEVILTLIVAFFVFATALQVIARLVIKTSMPWTEESARYALIWMTFLGSSFAAKRGTHIRVDLLESAVKKYGPIVKTIAFLIFLGFTVTMTVVGVQICQRLVKLPQYSTVLHLNLIFVYLALPVGMGLTSLRIIQWMWRGHKARKNGGEQK